MRPKEGRRTDGPVDGQTSGGFTTLPTNFHKTYMIKKIYYTGEAVNTNI